MTKSNFASEEAYFNWLCNIVEVPLNDVKKRNLLRDLHSQNFVWDVPNDDNRNEDGIQLRDTFSMEQPNFDYSMDGNATVLEMLVALSLQMDNILAGLGPERQIGKWFGELIDNLQLETYESFMTHGEISRIRSRNAEKIKIFLNRDYQRNGGGGLFPLRTAKVDQRRVEIWYQMMAYLDQNYAIR